MIERLIYYTWWYTWFLLAYDVNIVEIYLKRAYELRLNIESTQLFSKFKAGHQMM